MEVSMQNLAVFLWHTDASMPHLMVCDNRALLAFLQDNPDVKRDDSYITVKNNSNEGPEELVLVEFEGSISARLEARKDEAFDGHPPDMKGLEAISSGHRMYDPENRGDRQHFILYFHDSTFECLARSFKVQTHRMSMKEMLMVMVGLLS
jgi:hypothetical protein